MENLQEEFHRYVKNFVSNISSYKKGFVDLTEIFFQNLQPMWNELYFMTYTETFDGIEYIQKDTNCIMLSSADKNIIFEPRKIFYNISNQKKFDVVTITTNGEMKNLEGEILGINQPILVCPWSSQYVDEIERKKLMLYFLDYEAGLLYLDKMTEKIKKDKFKDNMQYMAEINKINSKELRNKIEKEIGLFGFLKDKTSK